MGLAAGIDLEPIPGKPGLRGMKVFERGLEEGLLVRLAGDCIAVGPPFISMPDELTQMGEGLRRAIRFVMQQG
jgi:beta-alanine--pyruvate transaminase